jgi:thymidylate synthase
VSGLRAGELVHVIADAHIYDRHVPVIREIIKNEPKKAPQLKIDESVHDFYSFTKNSFSLPGYEYTAFEGKIPIAV